MVGRTDDNEFLKRRTNQLVEETKKNFREWMRKAPNKASTQYRVYVPEDGEDYQVRMSIMKFASNRGTKYLLVSHESGLFADSYKLKSSDYKPLSNLGELVFA